MLATPNKAQLGTLFDILLRAAGPSVDVYTVLQYLSLRITGPRSGRFLRFQLENYPNSAVFHHFLMFSATDCIANVLQ